MGSTTPYFHLKTMIVLDSHHNKTYIKSASKNDLDLIREALTVFKKKFKLSQYQEQEWEITYLLSYKDFSFPTAYLPEIISFCKEKNIEYHLTDSRKYPGPSLFKLISKKELSLRDDQKSAFEAIKENSTGIIMMPTATGKSRVIVKTIEYRKVRTLIIVPKQNLQDQLTELLKSCFGKSRVDMMMPIELKEQMRIGYVDNDEEERFETTLIKPKITLPEGIMTPKEKKEKTSLLDESMSKPTNKIKFSLDMEALGGEKKAEDPESKYLIDKKARKIEKQKARQKEKLQEKNDWKKKIIKYKDIYIFCDASLDKLPQKFLDQFEMVIIDECHHSSATMIRECLLKLRKAAYRYYFSATPWRDHEADQKLLVSSIGSKIIYELSPEDAIKYHSIAKPEYSQKSSPEPKVFMKDKKKWRDVLEFGIIGNATRNNLIVEDVLLDLDSGDNIFIAVDEISHLDILKERFRQKGIDVDVIHGEMPRESKNKIIESVGARKSGICIGTMSVGEGTDMPNISSVFLASGGKSSIRFLQRIGRGARKGTDQDKVAFKVRDYFDWFHEKLAKHSMIRKKIFDDYFKNYGE